MKSERSSLKNALLLSVSLIIGTSGVLLICLWKVILENVLVLSPHSLMYQYWHDVPYDVQTDMYMFNWTNSEDMYNASIKPKFQEVGPYRFWMKEKKRNITWNQNGTVTYSQERSWYYENSEENGKLDDVITTGNPLAIIAAYMLKNWNYFIRKGVMSTLASTGYLTATVTHNVGKLLFEGYKEPLIKLAASMPFYSHLDVPKWENFGWTYGRNASMEFDGVFEMGTGMNSTLGKMYSWNHLKRTPYFNDTCGDVYGSSGELYHGNLKKDWISIFSTDVRRSLHLKYVKEEIVKGILGYRYRVEYYTLDNGTLYKENSCFASKDHIPSGLMDISSTRFGAPVFASMPHFYLADPYYTNLVDGMKPNGTDHEFYVILEPATGFPLKAHAVIQVNLLVEPVSGTKILENVPRFFLPVAWSKQFYEIPNFEAFLIKITINMSTICTSVGSLLIVGSVALLYFIVHRRCLSRTVKGPQIVHLIAENVPLKSEHP